MEALQATIGGWKFKACDEEGWLPAQVPGCVHTDLLRNGRIPDPFYGTNERRLQWIDKKDRIRNGGIFTDNFFDLVPGRPVTVEFLARSGSEGDGAFAPGQPGSLEVRSMIEFML